MILIYALLKLCVNKYGRPVTTAEFLDYAKKHFSTCVDFVLQDLITLEKMSFVTKSWSKEYKSFVWQTQDRSTKEVVENPKLFNYLSRYQEALGKHINPEDFMTILDILSDSERGYSFEELRKKIKEKYEMRTRWRWRWQDCWIGCDAWDRS
jgi:hypothetical protein